MTFTARELEFRITIAQGAQGQLDGQTVTLKGHRARVSIEQWGGPSQGQSQIAIYGVPLDLMKRLTTIGTIATQIRSKNKVEILAGDAKGKSTIFIGTIFAAWADFHSIPEVAFNIQSYAAMDIAMNPATATSFQGSAKVHDIMAVLAQKANLRLEDSGVTASLTNPAFRGSALDQIRKCAQAAGINQSVELGILAIWPRNGHRETFVPVVAPGAGLVGYPSFSSQFVQLDCEYLATAKIGGNIEIKNSELGSVVNGVWNINSLHHNLSSQDPGGPWFSHVEVITRVS